LIKREQEIQKQAKRGYTLQKSSKALWQSFVASQPEQPLPALKALDTYTKAYTTNAMGRPQEDHVPVFMKYP
jgi:hypothetical protein